MHVSEFACDCCNEINRTLSAIALTYASRAGASLEKLRYGVFTCSNWGWGYFNAYDYAAQLDLDFWMHMGDYLYEYGPSTYPSPEEAVRFEQFPGGLQPPYEMLSLDDYRARYKTYKLDAGLQVRSATLSRE